MLYAVIDIGSNSVRMMLHDGRAAVCKSIDSTRLAEGLDKTGRLSDEAMAASVDAIARFVDTAKRAIADRIFVFATEAVRKAANRQAFCDMAQARGATIDVVDGRTEALLGWKGCYTSGVCASLDVGGASTELAIGDERGLRYAESLPIGAARLKDAFGEDIAAIDAYCAQTFARYGDTPRYDVLYAIGGTATTFAAIACGAERYDPSQTDFYRLSVDAIEETTLRIASASMQERLSIKGLSPKRRDIIVSGGRALTAAARYLGAKEITVRESDNLEGYLFLQLEKERASDTR